MQGKHWASGRPINLLTKRGKEDTKKEPSRYPKAALVGTSLHVKCKPGAGCRLRTQGAEGAEGAEGLRRQARPGWPQRPPGRPAALLSCRGSSSPKFPGSLPGLLACPAAWSRNPGGGTPKPNAPPLRDPPKAPSRPPGDNPLRCQDTQMPPGPGPPTLSSRRTVTKRQGCVPLGSPLLHTPLLAATPRPCVCVRRGLGVQGGWKEARS